MITRIPQILPYNRDNAVKYAHRWSFGRNPSYYDFEGIGGDCTNFISQALFAGSGVMHYDKIKGWYYTSANNRSASWTGVNFLYRYLMNNQGRGPFAVEVPAEDVMPGDISQLQFREGSGFAHSQIIVSTGNPPAPENILTASHSMDRDYYPIGDYSYARVRFIHILGVRNG